MTIAFNPERNFGAGIGNGAFIDFFAVEFNTEIRAFKPEYFADLSAFKDGVPDFYFVNAAAVRARYFRNKHIRIRSAEIGF